MPELPATFVGPPNFPTYCIGCRSPLINTVDLLPVQLRMGQMPQLFCDHPMCNRRGLATIQFLTTPVVTPKAP
jgi:hypothetical protein